MKCDVHKIRKDVDCEQCLDECIHFSEIKLKALGG